MNSWIALLKDSLPDGEEILGEAVEADLRAGEDAWHHGAMGVGLRNIYFTGEVGFARVELTEPILALTVLEEAGTYTRFLLRPGGNEYRAASTDTATLQRSVDEALELELVQISDERWSMRTHAYWNGSSRRAGFIEKRTEGTEAHYYVVSHEYIRPDEDSLPSGPWESADIAFSRFREWRANLLAERR
ncbi:hypothetical protein ACRAWB_01930 [Leifsonia poae]|uniref:hypothetical protein n=1 Tax=Leifsonia poae TaxID=110933 RepID=UPI003D68F816